MSEPTAEISSVPAPAQVETPAVVAGGTDKASTEVAVPLPEDQELDTPIQPEIDDSETDQQPAIEKGPTLEVLTKTKELLGKLRADLEDLIKESRLTQEAQESGLTQESLEGEIARIDKAMAVLETESPEEAKEYLLAKYEERLKLQKSAERVLKAKEELETAAADSAVGASVEGELTDEEDLTAKTEAAEAGADVKDETAEIRIILRDLGVKEEDLQKIEELVKQPPEEQVDDLAEAQKKLGKKDLAKELQELKDRLAKATDEVKMLREEARKLYLAKHGKPEAGTDTQSDTSLEEILRQRRKAEVWRWTKRGGIAIFLLAMLVSQMEKGGM